MRRGEGEAIPLEKRGRSRLISRPYGGLITRCGVRRGRAGCSARSTATSTYGIAYFFGRVTDCSGSQLCMTSKMALVKAIGKVSLFRRAISCVRDDDAGHSAPAVSYEGATFVCGWGRSARACFSAVGSPI